MVNTERLCLGCMNDNGGEKVCPICGYDSSSKNPSNALPTNYIVKERYLLGKMLSVNGEGFTYIAWDSLNDNIVKVKEYFPIDVAARNPDMTVSIVSGAEYTFNESLLEFLEINRKIMSLELSALVPVIDVFEENGTAYAVLQNISGITLTEFLAKNGDILKWEQARALFLPLIDTLSGMNDLGIIHGGICTDTVIVGRDGKLRISDYSVKNLRNGSSQLKPQLFEGFAAAEQYGYEGLHTDKYTDVYGLCATLFRVLIGSVPPDATKRMQNDAMSIPAKFAEELPRHVLAALANGLQVLPTDRTKNIEIFKNELVYGEISGLNTKNDKQQKGKDVAAKPKNGKSMKAALIAASCTAGVVLIIALYLFVFGPFKDIFFGKNDLDKNPSSTTSVNAPVVDQIGDVESGVDVPVKLYDIPDFRGKYYSEIADNDEYEMFEIVVSSKTLSEQYPRGTVCSQSVAPGGEGVPRDTKIELVISAGSKEVEMPNLSGLTEDEAKLELLKQGFLYDNIEILEKYDEEKTSKVVLEQEPKFKSKVSPDIGVKIYINSYVPDDSSENNDTAE